MPEPADLVWRDAEDSRDEVRSLTGERSCRKIEVHELRMVYDDAAGLLRITPHNVLGF
jgi:hypothetical protein